MWRAPRSPGAASPPNKRMHATADTTVVKFLLGPARRVMRGVMPPERSIVMAQQAYDASLGRA
jgi:hypothetical protein